MEWKRGPVIGRGSAATVSLATFTSSGDLFAVKSSNLSNSVSLQNEQFLLSKLSSPYLVQYTGHEITVENGEPVYNIFLEYASGGTLHDEIAGNGGRLGEELIRSYTRNIIQGLDFLHRNGLVHCDIKSQNILITKEGAKIADLGCARFVEGETGFAGTPAFMSPEVARGEEQGFPADVWALGCTVIEMATGKIPWSENTDDPISALFKIGFSGEAPEIPGWLSEEGKDFLSKCLRRDPGERWTAKELLDHPFVDVKEIAVNSPNCVLDQDFWDSIGGLESTNQDLEMESLPNLNFPNGNSPAERMKNLIGGAVQLDWDSGQEWITVRSCESMEEKDEILVGTVSIPAEAFVSDSVGDEESSSIDQNLLLDMEFLIGDENVIRENSFSISDGFDSVSKCFNSEMNKKRILFASNSFCLMFDYMKLWTFLIFRFRLLKGRNQFLCFALIRR